MKTNLILPPLQAYGLLSLLSLAVIGTAAAGDETKKIEMRVLGASDQTVSVHQFVPSDGHTSHSLFTSDDDQAPGPHTFLGVETSRVGATLGMQLGLDRGIGLVVARVVADTGAAEVLEKHDIMVKFEDQLLVSPDQLGVLVRSKEPGTKIALTVIRRGSEQVVMAELRERKAKTITLKTGGLFPREMDPEELRSKFKNLGEDMSREEVEALMKELRGTSSSEVMVFADESDSPMMRMVNVRRGNVVFTDDQGTTKLISEGGPTRLMVMNTAGEVIFDGPVETAEQRAALDEAIQKRMEKVEALRSMEMKVDHDFEVEEDVQVVVPHASLFAAPASPAGLN